MKGWRELTGENDCWGWGWGVGGGELMCKRVGSSEEMIVAGCKISLSGADTSIIFVATKVLSR